MALQFSMTVRNARLDVIEATIAASPTMTIRTGVKPADCAAANSGTVLATIAMPSDWMAVAANASKGMLGSWQDNAADAAGAAGHFRIHQGATCHVQGSVTATGGGGDMTVDNVNFSVGQQFAVTAFTINEPNG